MISAANAIEDKKLSALAVVLAAYPNAEIVKYSPEKRCTIRVVRDNRNYFAKVYPPKFLKRERGEKIHDTGSAFWRSVKAGRVNFRVAKPVGWDMATQTLWHENLAGSPAIERMKNRDSGRIVHRIGQAVALIERCQIRPTCVFDYDEQLKDSAEFAEKVVRCFPHLSSSVAELLRKFKTTDMPDRELKPIHGDMHVDQWLMNGDELGLLDFEDFALGHPERDLAFFSVQLETEYGAELELARLNAAFLAGYISIGGEPDERLLNIYAAHKWFSKASRAATWEQANNLLLRSFDCLEVIKTDNTEKSGFVGKE